MIKQKLLSLSFGTIVADETGVKVAGAKQWLSTKYDVLGRVAYAGVYTHSAVYSQIAMQNYFDYQNSSTPKYEIRENPGYLDSYYSNNNFPKLNIEITTINYYDDYNFNLAGVSNPGTVYETPITNRTKSLSTGSKVKVLGTSYWISTVMYYDDKARPIYVYTNNAYLGTKDKVMSNLDFVGKVKASTSTHIKNDVTIAIIVDTYAYDYAGRLLSQKQKINSQTEEVIVQNSYDELGQLKAKGVGGTIYQARLQNIDYTYNIRGWLKGINDVNTLGTDLFAFKLNYNTIDDDIYGQVSPQYNGNISETYWKSKNDNYIRGNGYRYDALNRLNDAWGVEPENPDFLSTNDRIKKYPGLYDTRNIEYDKNGNIEYLRRFGREGSSTTSIAMDQLFYTYQIKSNKLASVRQGALPTAGSFVDGNIEGDDYTYDGNGNLTLDKNKGITNISYNHLNLPSVIQFAPDKKIECFYDAFGTKQKKKVTNGAIITTTDYAGRYFYQNNALQFIGQPEGYIEPNQGIFHYAYQLKDHLGNIRLSFVDYNDNGSIDLTEITEENNYYPFGLKHQGYNNVISSNANALARKYKYNGKELQDELNLVFYSYGAQLYDADLGRRFVICLSAKKTLT